MIRLSELLAQRELGLRLVAGAEDPAEVELRGAEVRELPDPRPWLDSGAMLLTTGVALGHGAHEQRLLVERTVEARAAAIGFSVGLVHPEVPDPVRESCAALQPPLIAIPAATPFRMVVGAVQQRTGRLDDQGAQRTLAMQTYLMEALSAPEPEAELLRRLGSLLSGTALLADETGAVEGAPNAALPAELWGSAARRQGRAPAPPARPPLRDRAGRRPDGRAPLARRRRRRRRAARPAGALGAAERRAARRG